MSLYDRIVAPLVEHARQIERETGRRIVLDVAVSREDFDLIAAELGFVQVNTQPAWPVGPLLVSGGITVSVKPPPLVFRMPADDEQSRERLRAFASGDGRTTTKLR